MMKARAAAMSVVFLLVTGLPSTVYSYENRPNVILIYSDDQGYGDASCYNPESKFQTPNLDRLAAEGLAFTDAHCSDTVCTPSRYGLLTGRYAWRTRLKRGVMGAEGTCLISDDRLTLASMLRHQGYATAMIGKWHLGMDFPGESHANRDWSVPIRDMPLDKGFEYFFGVPASLNYGVLAWFEGRHAKVPPTLFTAKKPNARHVDYRIQPPYQMTPAETQQLLGRIGMEVAPDFVDNQCLTRFTDKTIEWMKDHLSRDSEKPFFVYLPLTSPHYPVCPLPQFHGQGAAGGYGEFMIETDFHVGRVLDFLDEQNLAEDTIVIYTSDNGPERSWQERQREFEHASNGGFRGGKRSAYEGGHRVPFLIRWPAGISNAGRTVHQPICQTDLMATLAQLTDYSLPDSAGEDSVSFAAQFQESASKPRAPLIHHAANGRFAIRHEGWKMLFSHNQNKVELFDLAEDPSETRNLAARYPDVVERLTEAATQIVCRGRSSNGAAQPNDTGHWQDLTWIPEQAYLTHSSDSK